MTCEKRMKVERIGRINHMKEKGSAEEEEKKGHHEKE